MIEESFFDFRQRQRFFSTPQVYAGSDAHPAFYSTHNGRPFPGGKPLVA